MKWSEEKWVRIFDYLIENQNSRVIFFEALRIIFRYRDNSFYFSFTVKTEIKHDDKNVKSKMKSTTNDTNKTSIIQLNRNLFTSPKQENVVLSRSDSNNDTAIKSDSGAGTNSTLIPQNETDVVENINEGKLFQYNMSFFKIKEMHEKFH